MEMIHILPLGDFDSHTLAFKSHKNKSVNWFPEFVFNFKDFYLSVICWID